MSASYVALAGIAIPMVHWFGMVGFLWSWLAVELYQTATMMQLNRQMFLRSGSPSLANSFRLVGLSMMALTVGGLQLSHTYSASYRLQVGCAAGACVVFGCASFFLFGIWQLLGQVRQRFVDGQ